MIKRVCDRCGADISDCESVQDYRIEDYDERKIDLCTSCYNTFLEFMHKAKPWWEDKND